MKNRIAVITGGASGIGRSIAKRYGEDGYQVCIADIEQAALEDAVHDLQNNGIKVYGVVTDVADEESMKNLSDEVVGKFGPPGVICLNAGVAAGGPIDTTLIKDWEWVLAVNLWGVIHGVLNFLPILKEEDDGHIVFTSSIAGHLSYPGMGPYNASKHAVLTIAETLYFELQQANSSVGVSALCPGLVRTGILNSGRNRQEKYQLPALQQQEISDDDRKQLIEEIYANSLSPDRVADLVFDAVNKKQFYIFTDETHFDHMRIRHRSIENSQNPSMDGGLIDHIVDGTSDKNE